MCAEVGGTHPARHTAHSSSFVIWIVWLNQILGSRTKTGSWATSATLAAALLCPNSFGLGLTCRKRHTNVTETAAVPGFGSPLADEGALGVSWLPACAFWGQESKLPSSFPLSQADLWTYNPGT